MIIGIIIGVILGIGISGVILWLGFCRTVDDLDERLFGGEE